ncbi:MAG: adenine-specific DNA-methyltransferase [Rikenellaceae bacterium]|nr:adenine-specific DNA-methyltransferase [Rikenellaceae bacterium]
MNNIKLKQNILDVLKADERLWNEDKTELNQTLLLDLVENIDEKLIELLLQEKELREKFFVKIKDVYVFKTNDFRFFMEENKVDNSYTQYKNRIGLTDGKRFLKDTNDVVLNWPYKDCVLEGGQSTEEGSDTYFEYSEKTKQYETKQGKRKEIFFNQVLAADEIDRLFDHKALTNWKRFTKDGEQKVKEIKRDDDGTIKENLIIKGNNLLALHSLKKQFAGKVKLIYIDPPYNTGNDEFKYNDNFNHSTWLTFMKNRLEVAKKLLKGDGVIFVQIDNREHAYLKILMDEIFDRDNFLSMITLKAKAGGGVGQESYLFDICEHILLYAKDRTKVQNNLPFIEAELGDNFRSVYSKVLKNFGSEKYIKDINGGNVGKIKVFEHKDFSVNVLNSNERTDENYYKYFEKIFRTTNPQGGLMQRVMPQLPKKGLVSIEYKPTKGKSAGEIYRYYFLDGSLIVWLKDSAIKNEEKKTVLKLVKNGNLWTENLHQGIAKEGGVELKSGKKPELLLRRILEISTNEKDIVLDFHVGTGTTCAVAHKMGRQYIGIEQLDYGENDSVVRLQNVINGDQSGISKSVNWQGGGDFIYFELAKWNETAKEKIRECESLEELEKFFDEMYERYFLNYNLKIKEFKEKVLQEENFRNLSLDEQKKIFIAMLDNNQMYVNKTEMADKKFGISEEDQNLTNQFYNKEE